MGFAFRRTFAVAFDADTLKTLYSTHQAFVDRFTTAVDALENAGYLLGPEADQARQAARDSHIGR